MYCWLVWTEKGHKLFCWDWLLACLPCFDFDSFICRWCLLKYVTSCLNLINALFMFKSYSLLSPYPAHGLTYEMELSMLIYIFCSSFLCIYVFFYLCSMFPFSYDVRVFAYLGHVSRGCQKCWHKGWGVQQSQCIPVCFCGLTTKIEWLSNSVKVSIAVDIDNKRFIRLCIFHVTALTHRILENFGTCW